MAAPKKAMDAIEAEAGALKSVITIPLGDAELHFKPIRKWRASTIRAMREGNYDVWAEKALDGNDYRTVWQKADPDMDEIAAVLDAFDDVADEDTGK